MQIKNLWYQTKLHSLKAMQRIDRLLKFSKDDIAQFRLQVIKFHKNNGTKKVKEAYGIPKSTIYRWKQELEQSEGKLTALIPKSTAPKKRRGMFVDHRIVDWIRDERKEHPVGKVKLKPLLDEYCQEIGIKPPSESLIGKIIKRKNLQRKKNGRIYHSANSKCYDYKPDYKAKVKKCPKPTDFGHLGVDTITEFNLGMKRYIFNAVDIKLKFEFSYPYKQLNSKNGRDFVEKLLQVYPIKGGIRIIQTDNGLEFLGEFDKCLKKKQIEHHFIYPRCPKINGHIERCNRSLKEEFVNGHIDLLFTNFEEFKHQLMNHLIWYNTKRVHQSLGNITPIDYLLQTLPESHMYVTHTAN
jgi:transposase InsO family protein/transposase